jgi:hypothetical protein
LIDSWIERSLVGLFFAGPHEVLAVDHEVRYYRLPRASKRRRAAQAFG